MTTLTRQDVQSVVEAAVNRAMQRSVSRQDIQSMADSNQARIVSYLQAFMGQSQQLVQQSASRSSQTSQQIAALNSQIMSLSQELRSVRQLVEKTAVQRQQRVIVPMPADQFGGAQNFSYNGV